MSHTREDIFDRIKEVLHDQFEIEETSIVETALLVEDLDIDSIDAVDLMIELKSFTGTKMAIKDFKSVKTIGDVVDSVYKVVQQNQSA
jgi:acyl carrier protein